LGYVGVSVYAFVIVFFFFLFFFPFQKVYWMVKRTSCAARLGGLGKGREGSCLEVGRVEFCGEDNIGKSSFAFKASFQSSKIGEK
jgi:hypothetical protein